MRDARVLAPQRIRKAFVSQQAVFFITIVRAVPASVAYKVFVYTIIVVITTELRIRALITFASEKLQLYYNIENQIFVLNELKYRTKK